MVPRIQILISCLMSIMLFNSVSAQPRYVATPQTPLTSCAGFSDVYDSDWFCAKLRVMQQNGSITGYPDGTFRPNASVTRGQFSKIDIAGFGLCCNTTGGPHFSDVPVNHTFYQWIETAYNRGIINGYPNASDCTPYPAPCFKPDNNLTRGQMSKMVANTAGYNDPTAGRTPTYYDVPTYDTFFDYIERLVMNDVTTPPRFDLLVTCTSSIQPCFYTYSLATRSDIVGNVMSAYYQSNYYAGGAGRYAQVFGQGGWYTNSSRSSYDGVGVNMTTPNPSVFSGEFVVTPVGVTSVWNEQYVESGAIKDCRTQPSCDGYVHP